MSDPSTTGVRWRRFAGVAVRALLGALSLVILVPASFAVIGGYIPRVLPVGPFGAVLNTGLPWILGALIISTGLAALIVFLGGRKARILLLANVAVLAGGLFIAFRYASFAAQYGASYDLIRASDGFPPIPHADTEVGVATVDGQQLHAGLWLPSGAETAEPASLPALIFVHGGAFQGGFIGTRPTLLEAVRRAGIVAVDIEYRLSPPPRWNQAPADVLCAMAWVGSSPRLAMVDPKRVVIAGESAGGNLALVAGYAAGSDAIESSCPEAGAPVIPAGVVSISGTVDLEGLWRDRTMFDFDGTHFPERYIGGTPDAFPERYAAAEPFRLLRPGLPRTLFITGENDQFAHIERQRDTVERIRAAGVSIELIAPPFSFHGFDGAPNTFGAQLVEHMVPAYVLRITT